MKRRGKNTKEDVLVEVVRLSGCGKRSRGGVSAKGNLKQADASGTGKHAARHMRIDARRKPSVGPGAGRLSRRADQGKRRGRDNPSVRLGTKGQPEAPGPREKRDYRWQWRRGSPVSIPNTEVKPFSADGTWRVTARKSRSLPVLHQRHSQHEPVVSFFIERMVSRPAGKTANTGSLLPDTVPPRFAPRQRIAAIPGCCQPDPPRRQARRQ